MKKTLQFLGLSLVLGVLSSCASIVSKSNWPVNVDSNPKGATITITNRKGAEVYKGVTPAVVTLKSGAGFFKKESYTIKYELAGYAPMSIPLECKINGWYWGNIVFGGLIGWLIVDPATGAMYKLSSPTVEQTLTKNSTGSIDTAPSLKISTLAQVPKSVQGQLVRIN
jgi:hypothetical protein